MLHLILILSRSQTQERMKSGDLPEMVRIPLKQLPVVSWEGLLGEINQRITQEMNGLMNSVSLQIRRAIYEAMNEQFLPQLQASLWAVNGQQSHSGRNFPGENVNPKILLAGRLKVVLEMNSSEFQIVKKMMMLVTCHESVKPHFPQPLSCSGLFRLQNR